MWRYATPRRIAALNGDADPPPSAAGVAVGRLEFAVAAGLDAPATARAAVGPWLSSRVSETLLGDTQLLLSELVTNSVLHAQLARGAAIRVSVEISDGLVHLEVEDPGDGDIGSRVPDREHGGGFGLYLVETLAERWGSRHEGSTCVWADLALCDG
jgi:anti-sigma regulatory factor (Ser/Thr protein kinase)